VIAGYNVAITIGVFCEVARQAFMASGLVPGAMAYVPPGIADYSTAYTLPSALPKKTTPPTTSGEEKIEPIPNC
jgi:hypothetical protein